MDQDFEAQAYDAVCMKMGEAVWQLIITGQTVSQEALARVILELSEEHQELAGSIALSVLCDSKKSGKANSYSAYF
ncbi:hypothetical protein [Pantoea agglomerans]|uniref:hypothetical protein n=1 Tax=Enterobacter agglomerans TaxID=549 RepID=UPI003C7D7B73